MIQKRSPETNVTEVCLVEAAAQLFALHGFKATTTKDIAQLANLNEATLFRYFPRKQDLFLAALESHLSPIKLSRDLQVSLASEEDVRIVVSKIVAFILNVLIAQPELQRLLHVASFELSDADKIVRDHLEPIFDLFCAFFKRCSDKGSIRNVEPSHAVLSLLGAVAAQHAFGEHFTNGRSPSASTDQAVAEHTRICLDGLRPTSNEQRFSECAEMQIQSPSSI